jgi:hypothetical protein
MVYICRWEKSTANLQYHYQVRKRIYCTCQEEKKTDVRVHVKREGGGGGGGGGVAVFMHQKKKKKNGRK